MPEFNELQQMVQQRATIAALISSHLPLQPSRGGLKGPCPFHNDQAQSLMVLPDKNIFKCFGCGQEGGPVEFTALINSTSFEEAVMALAKQLNSAYKPDATM